MKSRHERVKYIKSRHERINMENDLLIFIRVPADWLFEG